MEKHFREGRRFRVMRTIGIAMNCFAVVTFYFVYRYLLEPVHSGFAGWPLQLLFAGIAVLVVRITLSITQRYALSVRCRVTADALIVGEGKRTRRYPWKEFRSAILMPVQLGTVVPIRFELTDGTYMPNQYLEDLYEFVWQILEHTKEFARYDEKIVTQISAMRGTF